MTGPYITDLGDKAMNSDDHVIKQPPKLRLHDLKSTVFEESEYKVARATRPSVQYERRTESL